jgi:hypothetical protein
MTIVAITMIRRTFHRPASIHRSFWHRRSLAEARLRAKAEVYRE